MKKGSSNQTLKCSLIDEKVSNNVTVCQRDDFCGYRSTRNRSISDSSVEICVVVDSDSNDPGLKNQLADSGIADKSSFDGDILQGLEQKIDRLSDIFQEQCRLLTVLKEDIRSAPKAAMEQVELSQSEILTDVIKKTVFQSGLNKLGLEAKANSESNSRAQSLLDAIEARHGSCVYMEIKDALASFLQSDEFKEHMVAATAESVKGVIGDCLCRDMSALYLPILENSHRRLVRQVTKTVEDAFIELKKNSVSLSKSVCKITKSLWRSIERHQHLLDAAADPQRNLISTVKCIVEELLRKELQQWRQKVLDAFSSQLQQQAVAGAESPRPSLESSPTSALQPAHPQRSIIDQLMMAAEISKQIEAGEVNCAFERALSAADLSLVAAACRAADRVAVFYPRCRLHQHVLLALLQQLSTDMLQDTLLKCRYIEDSILNLDTNNAQTRTHLPVVVGEVRKHLTTFLTSYPSHVTSRRVAIIIMAAKSLLK